MPFCIVKLNSITLLFNFPPSVPLPVSSPYSALSLSLICIRKRLLTLGVPCSSINNGAAAAAGSLDPLVSDLDALDTQSFATLCGVLNLHAATLSLLTLRTQQVMDAMEVDSNGESSTNIKINGEIFKVIYPPEPQPAGTVVLPGKQEDGVFHAMYKDINVLKRPALLELCKEYSLGSQGNMKVLREKITAFSENKIRWPSVIPSARRSHCGVRSGGIVKNKPKSKEGPVAAPKARKFKPSLLQRNDLLGRPLNTPLNAQLFDTERSKDLRTIEQKESVVSWAIEFDDSHPFIPREEIVRRRKAREEAKAAEQATTTVKLAEFMRSMEVQISNLTATFERLGLGPLSSATFTQRSGVLTNSGMLNNPLQPGLAAVLEVYHAAVPTNTIPTFGINTAATRQVNAAAISNPLATVVTPPVLSVSGMAANNSSANPTASVQKLSIEAVNFDYLTIAHRKVIKYQYSDVREPRQISFVADIARLDRVWDDEGPNWDPLDCGKNLLEINGASIALRYWCDIFRGKGDGTWSWLKKYWTEWKYVAERYRASSPDDFWKEFSSSNGERLHWKAITDQLRKIRGVQEEHLVNKAKLEYGARFSEVFVTNKGKVLTDNSAIARRSFTTIHKGHSNHNLVLVPPAIGKQSPGLAQCGTLTCP
ncbi:protein [Lentinula edodes]|uniref:Protein n=1 Tax=Lentinula edodes TaxID=5353 RepID=A0A1Q3EN45_LENED|nr:protein [Lentinula edodes]